MSCREIPDWFLLRRHAVIDVASKEWANAQAEVLAQSRGSTAAVCLHRLAKRGAIRRLRRGLYLVVDPIRETSPIAVASAAFASEPHYVTTDAALSVEGLIDQPIPTITVVLSDKRKQLVLGATVIRPVTLPQAVLADAEWHKTTIDGFGVRVASRVQAVVDALAEPHWMTHASLIPEVIAAFTDDEIAAAASGALRRSHAAAQRLGYLLEDARRPTPSLLATFVPKNTVDLRPGHRAGLFSTRWRVYG
jgi:predicted transcriptional regulator of viral defense system